jgi:hypothetical protein
VRDAIECENARGGAGVQKAEDCTSGRNGPRGLASRQDTQEGGRLEIIISIYIQSQEKEMNIEVQKRKRAYPTTDICSLQQYPWLRLSGHSIASKLQSPAYRPKLRRLEINYS